MDERPKYKMRFVGYNADGELKGNAPAYEKDEIRMLPLEYAQDWWWEMVDSIPDLVISEPRFKDSVYVEEVFVPPEESRDREAYGLKDIHVAEDAEGIVETPPEEEKPYICTDCGKTYGTKSEFLNHTTQEHSWTKEQCEQWMLDNLDVIEPTPTEEVTSTQTVGETLTVKVEPSEAVEPGEAFMVAPDAIEVDVEELELVVGDVDPGKVVKVKGIDKPERVWVSPLPKKLEEQTVKELKALIKQHGGEVDSQWRKADLIREARKLEESLRED